MRRSPSRGPSSTPPPAGRSVGSMSTVSPGGSLGRAEHLAKERDISVAGLSSAGVVVTDGDRVRLRHRGELDTAQDGFRGGSPTVWEATQHLLRCLDAEGEQAAAALLGGLDADTATAARELAYQLFRICTRRNRSAEAAACNGLVNSWPELSRLAADRGQDCR